MKRLLPAIGALGLVARALCACEGPPVLAADGTTVTADAGVPGECGATLKPAGKACVPTLASCRTDEVPLPGGTCRKVGVEACEGGIKAPPDWTCKRVGLPGTCRAGWARTRRSWCEPILPAGSCPDGTIEVIGKAACQPIADCGTGTWGNITATKHTLFVDRSYAGGGSDGTQARPFTTIQAALAALPVDRQGHIAVAAGAYTSELLTIAYRGVVIEGRCPQKVSVEGFLQILESKTTLRGLTIRNKGVGVLIQGGLTLLERVDVNGCEGYGIVASFGKVTIRDSVIAQSRYTGVNLGPATELELERSVVRDTLPLEDRYGTGWAGYGVAADQADSRLLLRDSVITGSHVAGLTITGTRTRIEGSVIRATHPCYEDHRWGTGLLLGSTEDVEVKDTLIAANHSSGIYLWRSKLTVERTIIRDTQPQWPGAGEGIRAEFAGELTLRDSVISSNRGAGVWLKGASATIERTLVEGTLSRSDGTAGNGIELSDESTHPSALTLTDSIVSGNRNAGVQVYGSQATITRTLVEGTLPRTVDGYYGVGVLGVARVDPKATLPATLSIKESTITGSAFAGVAGYGSPVTLQGSIVRDTREPIPRRWGGPGVVASGLGLTPATLVLKESVVAKSSDFGVYVEGGKATLERTAILDTRVRLGDGGGGFGVYAWPGKGKRATSVLLRDCQVARSGSAGLYVADASADVARSQLAGARGDSGGFGDGVVVEGTAARLVVLDSLVEESQRCGLLALRAPGLLDRTKLTRGMLSVLVEGGSPLRIGSRVELSGNQEDRVTFGDNLAAPPRPALPPPPTP